jgi:cobalt/nickel transport system permease protein
VCGRLDRRHPVGWHSGPVWGYAVSTDLVAMHMSDGIVNAPTALVFGVVALAGLAYCAIRARRDLDDRTAPLAGLVAAFVFAVQMLNFPILPGVSGHLLGGALVAILVGPYVGALCVAIVLALQALLFADGGLSALGTNITNMALIGTFVGYGVAMAMRGIARRSRGGLLLTAFVAAFVNTVAASLGFVLEYAMGGEGLALGTVLTLMAGLHTLIGIGEGIITALTVGAVAAARPDLIYLLRGSRDELELRTPSGAAP